MKLPIAEWFARAVDLMVGAAVVLGAGDAMAEVEGHGRRDSPDATRRARLPPAWHIIPEHSGFSERCVWIGDFILPSFFQIDSIVPNQFKFTASDTY